jgi:hypothetical protein
MNPERTLRLYADLAELYERQGQPKQRDWFLVLGADAALAAGRADEADRLIARLLSLNPHHFLKPFASFAEALRSPDVQGYVGNLRGSYPPDKAEQLLQSLRPQPAANGKDQEGAKEPPSEKPLAQPRPQPPARPAPPHEVQKFRVRPAPEEVEESAPVVARHTAAPPQPRAVLAPPPPKPRATPRPQPAVAADPAPPVAAPEPRPKRAAEVKARHEPAPETSALVPMGLFVVLLAVSVGVAVYTFVRPFLPASWLP